MDQLLPQFAKNPPNLVRAGGAFDWDRLMRNIDPAPAEESEAFVREIYEQRHNDSLAAERASKTRC